MADKSLGPASYEMLCVVGEGTYGKVFLGVDMREYRGAGNRLHRSMLRAVKRVKRLPELESEGVPVTTLREIQFLKDMREEGAIVHLLDVCFDSNMEDLFLVFNYAENDLAGVLDTHKGRFKETEAKWVVLQVLEGLSAMHRRGIVHRDVKPSNILYSEGSVQLCDFGLARRVSSHDPKNCTPHCVTLWYRPPEMILGSTEYGTAVDIWAAGALCAELLTGRPLAAGGTEVEQLQLLFDVLGSPVQSETAFLHSVENNVSSTGRKLLRLATERPSESIEDRLKVVNSSRGAAAFCRKLLSYIPAKRPSALECTKLDYFTAMPLPADAALLPQFVPAPFVSKKSPYHCTKPKDLIKKIQKGLRQKICEDEDVVEKVKVKRKKVPVQVQLEAEVEVEKGGEEQKDKDKEKENVEKKDSSSDEAYDLSALLKPRKKRRKQ